MNRLVSVSKAGLVLGDEEDQALTPWQMVEDISIGTTPDGETAIYLMVIRLLDDRLILAAEGHPAWRDLIASLPECLPGAMPYQFWSAILSAAPEQPIMLFINPVGGHA